MAKRRGRGADGRPSRDSARPRGGEKKSQPRRPRKPPPSDDEQSVTGDQSGDRVEHLPKPGERPNRGEIFQKVHREIRDLREACGQCRYRRICAFAPVKFQTEVQKEKRSVHRHEKILKDGLRKISRLDGDWENALVAMLTGREKDALLAACLLSIAWKKRPASLVKLINYTQERCDVDGLKADLAEASSADATGLQPGQGIDPDALQCRMFRGQVIRMASFSTHDEVLKSMQDLLVLNADDDGRLFQYEAVGVLGLLVGRQLPPDRWIKGLQKDIKAPFLATFATRAPGNGGLDLFFPYRRGKRRSYLYLRRDPQGGERLSSIDKIRVDSLLHRMFLVFKSDTMKIHRIFKELCRHLNVRAGEYNVDHVLAGFERLERDDLLLLGFYAPALARAVGHYIGKQEFHRLVKFLYGLRTESGRRGEAVAAHEKVVQAREEWEALVEQLGKQTIKEIFSVLFRLNASYKKRVYTTTTYLKIGEVAYLLTAMAGWNPKGLEIELKQARKALAFVAYGLQPPGKWSRIRVGKIRRAYERLLDGGKTTLERGCEQGMRYMAALHGFEDFKRLEADVAADEDWSPTLSHVDLPAEIDASAEDFSEFEDSGDSMLVDAEEADELFIVVEDDEASESGRLKTQRMTKQRPPKFYDNEADEDDEDESDEDEIDISDIY